MRVGIGYDFHPLDDERPLVLDEDALARAITEALLGAACLGTLGALLADRDSADRDRDGIDVLADAVRRLESENYQVVNVDVTVVCEGLEVESVARSIARRLAPVLHTRPSDVSVKGTSNAGMTVIAVASIAQIEDIDALHASIRSGGG